MVIKILGSGCPKCRQLEENVKEALKALSLEAEVLKVTEVNKIVDYGVMKTPALVIDEKVKASGKVLSTEKIKPLL